MIDETASASRVADGPLPTAITYRRWRWIRPFVMYGIAFVAALTASLSSTVPDLPVQFAATVLIIYALFSTVGYRALRPHELAWLHQQELHHYSSASAGDLLGGDGTIRLDPALCRRKSLLVRSDRPWSRPRRASYCFLGPAHPSLAKHNVNTSRQRTLVVLDGAHAAEPVLIRRDGSVALPQGYTGPGRVLAPRD